MTDRWRTAGGAAVLATLAAALYTTQLSVSPPYLMHDELMFALQARSIATEGRDLSGRLLPVFFVEPEFPAGRDPLLIYATAIVLKVLPFHEASVRMAVALASTLNVVLIYLIGRRALGGHGMGLVAAALLAFTPVHFIRGRLALSPFLALPFVLLWLYCLHAYLQSGSRSARLAGVGALAAMIYSYLACVVMAPLYLLMTGWVAIRREGTRVVLAMIIVFVAVLVPMLAWYATHPERYSQIMEAYRLYGSGDPTVATPWPPRLRHTLGMYWEFFSPDFLFVSGDSSLINSTRQAGIFPLAFAPLLAVGAYNLLSLRTPFGSVLVLGLLTAPLAGLVSGAIEMNRLLFVIPFAALVAAQGVGVLLGGSAPLRVVALILVASVPVQFGYFYRDYMSGYRERAAPWFGGNVAGAFNHVIERGSGAIYVSRAIPFGERYWWFYGRQPGVPDRATFYREFPSDASSGSYLVCGVGEPACVGAPGWELDTMIHEPGGAASFAILRRP